MEQTTLYLDSSWRVDLDNKGPKLAHHAHVKDILDKLPEYHEEDGPGMMAADRVGRMILQAMNKLFFLSKRVSN